MAYLAYDPERVAALRRALADALTELDSLSLADPEAADATRSIRSARGSLRDTWIPQIGDVLRCRAMNAGGSAQLDLRDLRNAVAYEMAVTHGWLLVEDPSAALDSLTTREAAALGDRLDHGDIASLLDSSGEREWLYRQLQTIAADPALTAAFLRTCSSWALLCNELADRLMAARHAVATESGDDSTAGEVARLEADFASLGAIYRSRSQSAAGPAYYGEIADMQPYAGAMLVTNLALDAMTLAAMTDSLLRRWRNVLPGEEGYGGTLWGDMTLGGANTADILFTTLLDTPGACTEYVRRSADDLASMWISTADPTLTARVAFEGTSPENLSITEAGGIIESWLEYFQSSRFARNSPLMDGYPADYRVTMAAVVAPYLAQFAVTNEDWGASDESMEARLAGLAFLVQDSAALDALISRGRSIVEGLVASAGAPPDGASTQALKAIADTIGVVGQLAVNRAVANERQREQLFELGWALATIGTAWLSPVTGILAGVGVDTIWNLAGEHLAFMPDAAAVEASARRSFELGLVGILADLAAMMWASSPHRSLQPPQLDTTAKYPLNDFATDLDRWLLGVAALDDHGASTTAASIDHAVSTFIARWSVASSVTEQH